MRNMFIKGDLSPSVRNLSDKLRTLPYVSYPLYGRGIGQIRW